MLGLSVVLVPAGLFAGSLIESGQQISQQQDLDSIRVPEPPAEVKDWPLIGDSVYEYWSEASQNLEPLLLRPFAASRLALSGLRSSRPDLIGVGLLVADVPHAGLWSLMCLILAVLQLPPLLVVGPIIVYMFSQASTPVAVIFMIWEIAASMSDTFPKPILLARS